MAIALRFGARIMRSAWITVGALVAFALPLAAQDSPVLRGTLRDSTGRPLAGVDVGYLKISTKTDSAGNFRLTPVPTGRITVRFTRGRTLIGEIEADVTSDTTTGVQVDVLRGSAEPRTFAGVVVDSGGHPARGATVEVMTASMDARTDSLGRFTIRNLPARFHFVRVRRVGWAPTFLSIDLTDSVPKRARIVLRQYAGQNLGLVVVRAERPIGRIGAFLQRAERRGGWGTILTEKDIAARNALRTSDLFQTIAGVRVSQDRFGRGTITGRGNCLMALYINGFPAPQQRGAGIDDMVSTLDVVGIEVYNGQAGVPPDLILGPPNSCGTIGVWTK